MGSYYTPPDCVDIAWRMLGPHLEADTIVIDTACGYGNFLKGDRVGRQIVIGYDFDATAVEVAARNNEQARFFQTNSLHDVHRSKFGISDEARLAVVGNPPYNDRTSIIRHRIKNVSFFVDPDITRRDLGISFLLSYNKLKADWVCVLHPLSYLIKPANFKLLRNFAGNYRLMSGLLISSSEFSESSKSTPFPIVIALYERDGKGMDYDGIRSFRFRTKGGADFCLNDFDYIPRYIAKYPSKNNHAARNKDSLFFWTMRDINALKRNRTFVRNHSAQTITIDKEKLDYYAYVDVFRRNIHRLPFYFGNCDVMIDNALFKQYRDYFVRDAIDHHPSLERHFQTKPMAREQVEKKIDMYFSRLLGEHLVC